MSYRLWTSKPLKTAMNVVSGCLQSDLWKHNFDSRYEENGNNKIYFSSLEELLTFESNIEKLLSSIFLKNTGDRLKYIMDASAPDSWLSVVLARAKKKLSGKTYILKFNDYSRWEIDEQEKKDLEGMIDGVITNLHIMYVMLAVNKADDVDGINGKHYFWEKQGHMSDLLMKLKGCGMNCLEAREQDAQRVSGGVSALRRVQDRGGRASVADLEARV